MSIFDYNATSNCAGCGTKVPVTNKAMLFCEKCGAKLVAVGVSLQDRQKAEAKAKKQANKMTEPLFDLAPYTRSKPTKGA